VIAEADGTALVYYMHIFKTGGNTFRSLLAANYPARRLLSGPILGRLSGKGLAKTVDDSDSDVRRLLRRIKNNQQRLSAVAASLPYGLHKYLERPVLYITFMREPVSRCRSTWFFAYEHRHDRQLWSILEEYDLDLEKILRAEDETIIFQNDQTRMIAGTSAIRVGEQEFELARENINRGFLLVGALDHFDASFGYIARHLGWRHADYERRNVGSYPATAPLPANAMRLFAEANEWDIKLFDWLGREYLPRRLEQPALTRPAAQLEAVGGPRWPKGGRPDRGQQ
jgi:hypothetical protein